MSAISDIFSGRSNIDFPSKWKKAATVSAVLVAIAVFALVFRGFNLGIEFEGGQSWELQSATTSPEELREAITPLGLGDARIQRVANDLYRVRAEVDGAGGNVEAIGDVSEALAAAAGVDPNDVSSSAVGASWGQDVTSSAVRALIVFGIVIFLYISVRLEWKMAVGALAAVVHDILITVGFYALFQFEVTAATVIAFLTILGYSLYDTLIVFDKIRENERRASTATRLTYSGLVSHSINQVVMRSINTTITSVIPVLSVLVIGRFVLGKVTLQEFAIALLVGLMVGTYSSLFVAAPIVAWVKEREPGNIERRTRLGDEAGLVDSKVIAEELKSADRARAVRAEVRKEGGDTVRRISGTSGGVKTTPKKKPSTPSSGTEVIPPRPRKKKKK